MGFFQFLLFFLVFLIIFQSCEEPVFTPKPRGYPKVDFPQKEYQTFDANYCNFTFEYPKYAVVEQDQNFFGETPNDPCWFDVFIPKFDARIHCSYSKIGGETTLDHLKADAFELVEKHKVKARYVEEIQIKNEQGASGFLFNLDGAVASPCQFYLTDSTQHFLRGSLYFNTQALPDSLAPMIEFVREDLKNMIRTLEWKN